jgi:hypothetical protein
VHHGIGGVELPSSSMIRGKAFSESLEDDDRLRDLRLSSVLLRRSSGRNLRLVDIFTSIIVYDRQNFVLLEIKFTFCKKLAV